MITGSRIILRFLEKEDIQWLYRQLQKKQLELKPMLSIASLSYEQLMAKYLENGLKDQSHRFLVVEHNHEPIGIVWAQKDSFWEGYYVGFINFSKEHEGKGFFKEALSLFSAYMFASEKVMRLQIAIPGYHRPSIAIAQKNGYKFEGILRKALYLKGEYVDLCLYSLLEEECLNIDKVLN